MQIIQTNQHKEIVSRQKWTIRRNTYGDVSASLRTNIRIFTTITSDEQYFLNEKAVCQRYGFPAYVTVDIT